MSSASGESLIEWMAPATGERILDAGCGMGHWSARLAAAGAEVTGVDALPHLLEQARIAAPDCRFIAADLSLWEPAAPFDGIFAHALLNWWTPPETAATRLLGWLRAGGRLAAFLGAASPTARELPAYYDPAPAEYANLLLCQGFNVERWEEAHQGFLILARRSV